MTAARTSPFAPWLLLAVIALIAYGSLYPFRFEPEAVRGGLAEALRELTWARAGRADRLFNVVLYIPLGFCVYLWLGSRLGFWRSVFAALALGSAVSLAIEVAQAYLSPRVPSLRDLTLNVSGTLLGAIAGATWNALSRLLPVPARSEAPRREPAAFIVVALWVGWRLAPFVPRIDLGQLKGALRPLFDPQLQWTGVASYLCLWLVVSHALFSLTRRQVHIEALLILIAVVLAGRLLFGHQGFIPAELAALLLVLPGIIVFDRIRETPTRVLLLASLAVIVVTERLFPFDFVSEAGSFDLLGPLTWFADGALMHSPSLMQKLFVFSALWWLLHVLGCSNRVASACVVGFILCIEILQLWLPARQSSLRDPLLALGVVLILTMISPAAAGPRAAHARHRLRV